jgi:tetratricopeptide (TPR) repeat protein
MKNENDISKELFEAIERYINGTMEPNELKDFNDYLKIDPEFKKQVEDTKIILLNNKKELAKEELVGSSINLINTNTNQILSKKTPFYKSRILLLMTALVIGIGGLWFFSSSPNKKLYKQYFKTAPEFSNETSTNNSEFYEFIQSYAKGNYNMAIDKLQNLNKEKPNNDTINYFLGITKMANNNVSEAIPFLERCVAQNSFSSLNNAYYYLGLAYLNEGNIELAKKQLSLSENNKSKEILLQLSN